MGMEFLFKQLGINPDEIKQAAGEFANLARVMDKRISAMEKQLNAIAEKLGISPQPENEENENG